ncbi:MAG: hypothetical protein IPL46_32130 [Saprospiraceae bacterium]|nr:hypothetical protein [Saprospiraceae bacterium]
MNQEIKSLDKFLKNGISLENRTIQQIDFSNLAINWKSLLIKNATFLGCTFLKKDKLYLIEQGALVIDRPEGIPYDPFRKTLYTWHELLQGIPQTEDLKIFDHFQKTRYNPPINEALWQRIHDHAIDEALRDFIQMDESGMPKVRCIGIMGGHRVARKDISYKKVALLSKWLTEGGYIVVSGGGPGIMEAANLGAFLAGRSDNSVTDAIVHMSDAPSFVDQKFTDLAIEVFQSYTSDRASLAIPTWFYGHEPSNVFSTAIAKYFSNSIREDTLLAICMHGVIFAPGSAGTTQEIFMDAAQNHYGTYNFYSPMVFLGSDHYEHDTMIYPLLKRMARGQSYEKLLFLSDDLQAILDFIIDHPPVPTASREG